MPPTLSPFLPYCLLAALCLAPLAPALAQQAATPAPAPSARSGAGHVSRDIEANLLILDVRLDGFILSDGLSAYQDGPQILLPLGELARLLTLAITVQPEAGSASGYVLREDRTFGLNVGQSLASLAGNDMRFEAKGARVIGDDIYVSSELLSRWLPIDFEISMSAQQLQVKPREKLPLQERLERERAAKRLGGARPEQLADPGYPRALAPYQWIDRPFIDQTFGADVRAAPGSHQLNAAYTAYLTADVLGMEGAAYVSSSRDKPKPDWRMTLGRNDPDAGLLGPLRARSFVVGNISVPSVANVMTTSGTGRGVAVSNRPLDQPTSFDRQSLRGDLPPGWDVTLYYNDALLGFQASRTDGLYAFDDLPLSFGRNEFLLVFNGPLGQMRTERKSFLLDQSIVKPGEILYSLVQHHADNGDMRSVARFDMGLTKKLAGSAGFIRMPRPVAGQNRTEERGYAQLGLRGYWDLAIVTSEMTFSQSGGMLAELGLKTRLGNYAVDLLHTQVQGDFDSDAFSASGDPVKQRDKLRVVGTLAPPSLPRMPVAVEAQREVLKSGATNEAVAGRLSLMLAGTSITNGLAWQRAGGAVSTNGNLQLSRRVADMGLSGQLAYSVKPEARFDSLALTADRNLASGYRVNAGLMRTFSAGTTLIAGGLSKNFGSFALAVSASYSNQRQLALGLQLFVALGREPRTGKWFSDAVPMASMGAVSARAFVDRNLNGLRDPDEELVPNASFIINSGGRHPTPTADDGTAFMGRLAPGRYSDIALDASTLEDPLWKSVNEGVRVLPRPGLVQMLEFPVVSTSEVDGTVFLLGKTGKRGIGDAVVELVDSKGAVVMSTPSSSDGFYLLRQVMPGRYTLRISPAQATKLALASTLERPVEVRPDGDFISGQDLELKPVTP
ncbi:hypothetical protein RCH06_003488 [Polaromonas sp. CG_9.5]|uniref:MSCRAMM family protein n=1 Tax=Polaromonas sp. CG_9.5 TaxID=3071705 RepID=UPI002E07D46F|nr:hypothetical protein [Polaromonas sp. CG_9.5]